MRYGKKDCEHVLRHRKDGWEEGCGPTICIECGAFGCLCDAKEKDVPHDIFFGEGLNGDANINGKWSNPYLEIK